MYIHRWCKQTGRQSHSAPISLGPQANAAQKWGVTISTSKQLARQSQPWDKRNQVSWCRTWIYPRNPLVASSSTVFFTGPKQAVLLSTGLDLFIYMFLSRFSWFSLDFLRLLISISMHFLIFPRFFLDIFIDVLTFFNLLMFQKSSEEYPGLKRLLNGFNEFMTRGMCVFIGWWGAWHD